jgi:hypothetical protein
VVGPLHGKKGKVGGVAIAYFTPYFIVNAEEANVKLVADHVEQLQGKKTIRRTFQSILAE